MKKICIDYDNKGVIYACDAKTLYRTGDDGDKWLSVLSGHLTDDAINFIRVYKGTVFVCTKNGVFSSNDGKSNWKKIFIKGIGSGESDVSHIAFSKDNKIYLATGDGLFISSENGFGWAKDNIGGYGLNLKWIEFLDDTIFAATEKGVYKNSGNGWKRIFVTNREIANGADIEDGSLEAAKQVNSIAVSNKGAVVLAADSGIFISEDKGETWRSFIDSGLASLRVKLILISDVFYAMTDKGIFVFSDKDKSWQSLYKGMATKEVNYMSLDSGGAIWAVTKKGLYRRRRSETSDLALNNKFENEKQGILKKFAGEPAISDVQEAAIEYAEVHPDKIKHWRSAVKRQAVLPNVSVGLDRYITDYWHWDSGTNPDTLQRGKDAVCWDVSMTWDMGELIWNNDQTSIDTRSKLLVELRDDIMNEVTRTYFERRRLQIEMSLLPPQDLKLSLEKELRLQELTADIDALTGGYFSKRIYGQSE